MKVTSFLYAGIYETLAPKFTLFNITSQYYGHMQLLFYVCILKCLKYVKDKIIYTIHIIQVSPWVNSFNIQA